MPTNCSSPLRSVAEEYAIYVEKPLPEVKLWWSGSNRALAINAVFDKLACPFSLVFLQVPPFGPHRTACLLVPHFIELYYIKAATRLQCPLGVQFRTIATRNSGHVTLG